MDINKRIEALLEKEEYMGLSLKEWAELKKLLAMWEGKK